MIRPPPRSPLFPSTTLSRSPLLPRRRCLEVHAHRRPPRHSDSSGSTRVPQAARLYYGLVKRSEEHTSELQSQSNLVCRLLLEKKNRPNRPPPRSAAA